MGQLARVVKNCEQVEAAHRTAPYRITLHCTSERAHARESESINTTLISGFTPRFAFDLLGFLALPDDSNRLHTQVHKREERVRAHVVRCTIIVRERWSLELCKRMMHVSEGWPVQQLRACCSRGQHLPTMARKSWC